ncbi:polysaccharide deacetylase family protein [Nannocystis bainbridge]|uniref:Polysaccharide deacetylase family protein n=1 Tax=Nannocystis bainbridge TaxID=2995303 RepID=A0ABT5E019_9BACT|nr:polysaccharide deacetylase family protein [Nannocystis bainbridge]MDC0719151.1 polysaccharide deacetylase family protein [Nannocystis bainbridge]
MPKRPRVVVLLTLVIACTPSKAPVTAPTSAAKTTPAAKDTPAVAVTFDDLIIGGRDLELVRTEAMTRALLGHFQAGAVPVVGFVNGSKLEDGPAKTERLKILKLWTDAGIELGNHTFSHPSLHATPVNEYEADIVRGEPDIRALNATLGLGLRWFRHPYLHTGTSLEIRAEIDRFLAERGYTVAPVTVDNADWLYNFVYTDAKTRGDEETMARVGAAYVASMEAALEFHERATEALFGRPIRHVLLLHANEINAAHFDEVVAIYRRRDYRFITLEEALKDPAYQEADRFVGKGGVSWLYRWDWTRGRNQVDWKTQPEPPAFVQELFAASQ